MLEFPECAVSSLSYGGRLDILNREPGPLPSKSIISVGCIYIHHSNQLMDTWRICIPLTGVIVKPAYHLCDSGATKVLRTRFSREVDDLPGGTRGIVGPTGTRSLFTS